MQEIQGLAVPVPPEGNAIVQNVEDMQSQSRLKVARARLAVDNTIELLAEDVLTGTYWLELRQKNQPARHFGPAASTVWPVFQKEVIDHELTGSLHDRAAEFLHAHSPSELYRDLLVPAMPSAASAP